MAGIISVKAKNYKNHENIDFTLDGKSIVLIGDSGEGKTNFMTLILAHLGIISYPDDAQKAETNGGFTEITLESNGTTYVITREFKDGKLKRFRMTADGRKVTWEDEIKNLFNGLNPSTSYFDYAKFFFELKSSDKRFEYLIQCSIGPKFAENKKLIDSAIDERGNVGTQKRIFESRLATSDLNADNYKSMLEEYDKPYPTDQYILERDQLLATRVDAASLLEEISLLKDENSKTQIAEDKKVEFTDKITSIDNMIKKLMEDKADLEAKITRCDERIASHPIDKNKEAELQARLATLTEDNLKIEQEATRIYTDRMKDVELFNTKRERFLNDKVDLDRFLELEEEWQKLDKEIKGYKQENIELFKSKLPIEGLEIKEFYAKEGDQNSKIRYEIWWNGREVSFDKLSKGETLKFAILVQQALTPQSLKLLFIPEGQSMGSKLDEILEVARNYGMQTIVEITERKHKFEMRFEEEFL